MSSLAMYAPPAAALLLAVAGLSFAFIRGNQFEVRRAQVRSNEAAIEPDVYVEYNEEHDLVVPPRRTHNLFERMSRLAHGEVLAEAVVDPGDYPVGKRVAGKALHKTKR